MSCLFSCLRLSSACTGTKTSAEKYEVPPRSSPQDTLRTLMPPTEQQTDFIQSLPTVVQTTITQTSTIVHTTTITTTPPPIRKYKEVKQVAATALLPPPPSDLKYDAELKSFVVDETSPVTYDEKTNRYVIDKTAAAKNPPLPIDEKDDD